MNIHQNYLHLLGERLGLPLCFDENQQCLLLLDDNLLVSLSIGGDGWLMRGLLMEVSPNNSSAFWREMLVINKELAEQRRGTLAYVEESQALLYVDSVPYPGDTNDLVDRLEHFIAHQEKLQDLLRTTNH